MMQLLGLSGIELLWLILAGSFSLALVLHLLSAGRQSAFWDCFQDLIRYGKTKADSGRRQKWLRVFDVPKRWFSHFYAVSVIWNGFLLLFLLQAVLLGHPFPVWLQTLLHFLCGNSVKENSAEVLSVLLVQTLLWLHCFRRLTECVSVSVFSNGVIHLVQYCFGLSYYIVLGLTVTCRAASLGKSAIQVDDLLAQVGLHHLVGTAVYLWASLHQHRCLVILADLRKIKSGQVVNMGHMVPYGDWFEQVSCPHYLTELLIYVAFCITFGGQDLTWWLIVAYVLFNQALTAVLSHEYYIKKFESYPKHRKAFIPFIF
ncbi:polyprenol reductase [Latimeria chalumnae]|uniref:Polyprenal reductase n=2 Tax=Latimeria TaxID=7896 RepID=H3AXF2_LATCH|nr:PREDICTED: polyprenol reductase [Latimeria chalumnae]CCP19145.1 5 alpha-reductase 3 [Latimeria menadoensis]|eukprot:XP_006001438.1 PREDICTED: polyprenol reductase [Latimeria chalumnae]